MSYNILIYEDNNAFRQSLEDLLTLSNKFTILLSSDNCITAANDVLDFEPDVILMDIDMPGKTGIQAVQEIRKVNRDVLILMLTVFEDNSNVLEAIRAGASGYLLKINVSDRLIPAIKELLAGGAPMSPSVARMVVNSMQQPAAEEYHFTKREKEILALLCKGYSYKMIADNMTLTFETIRSYIKGIYSKLQVHSATEAVSKAIRERLV